MPFGSQAQRAEQKLGLILGQVGSLRARLNALAIQQGLFESLSLIVGTGAIGFAAAFVLEPLKFLCVATLLAVVLIAGLIRAIRRAWRMRATSERAALVADQRAGLKGRLATVVWLARTAREKGHLWPYLLEDTLSLREQFIPGKVEPRRISRAIYGLLVYCLLAALLVPLALMNRRLQVTNKAAQSELEVDVNDLDVRPADPDLGTAVEITGDAAAMRRLADKLAAAGDEQGEANNALGNLMGRARDLAGGIQDRLTGQQPGRSRIRLRLTDNGAQRGDSDENPASRLHLKHRRENGAGQFERERDRAAAQHLPLIDSSSEPTAQRDRESFDAQNSDEQKQGGESLQNKSSKDALAQAAGDDQGGGGSSHGSGSDPQHLFGRAEEPPLGSEGFEIMIEARPAERGAKTGSQSYVPPKVRAALNPRQHPDEPIARSMVPDDDRAAIKRVFER